MEFLLSLNVYSQTHETLDVIYCPALSIPYVYRGCEINLSDHCVFYEQTQLLYLFLFSDTLKHTLWQKRERFNGFT